MKLGTSYELYTDGSKMEVRVGAGLVIYKDQVEIDNFHYRLIMNQQFLWQSSMLSIEQLCI